MPSIDFSEVKGIEPVPAGEYPATIVSAEEGVSQNGNPKIDIQWKIESGEKATDGRIVFEPLTFTEKAMFRVKQTMLALGYPKNFKGDVTPDMLLNKSAIIVVDIQPGNGVDPETGEAYPPRNRVKKVKPLGKKSQARK